MRANRFCAVLGLGLAVLMLTGSAIAADSSFVRDPFDEQVDGLVDQGFEHPAEALVALKQLQREHAAAPDDVRVLLQAIGSIEARAGAALRAASVAEQLLTLAADGPGSRAMAASNLVRALIAENAGQLDVAAAFAQAALPAFEAGCPGAAQRPDTTETRRCDYRSAWRARQLLAQRALSLGVPATANSHTQAALALAEWAGDVRRQSGNLGMLAMLAQGRGEPGQAQRLMGQAKRLAAQSGDLVQRAMAANGEARLASMLGDH